jgi:hypothetical protein
MSREDVALLAGSAVALVALITASWRADPSTHDVTVILYSAAGALEFLGVAAIGHDLSQARRRARVFAAQQRIISAHGLAARSRGFAASAVVTGGQPPTTEQRIETLERHARGEPARIQAATGELRRQLTDHIKREVGAAEREAHRRDAEVAALIGPAGPGALAWIGFAGLLLGLLVGTAANILSAMK